MHHPHRNQPAHNSIAPRNQARGRRTKGTGLPNTVWLAPIQPDTEKCPSPSHTGIAIDGILPRWALARLIAEYSHPGETALVADFSCGSRHRCFRSDFEKPKLNHERTATTADIGLVIALISHPSNTRKRSGEPAGARPANSLPDGVRPVVAEAGRALKDGGILAVALASPHSGPEFADRTGSVIHTARREGFLYLQHIVVVDAPVHGERISASPSGPARCALRLIRHTGIPVHARAHLDVLIFTRSGKTDTHA